MKEEKQTLEALKGGEIRTSPEGFHMEAKLNGKEWVAKTMMSTEATGRVLGRRGKESISLPFRQDASPGKKVKFGAGMVVDLMDIDGVGLWSGESGEMTYTKVDDTAMEGTFSFTANAYDDSKKLVVTEGTFRVLLGKQ